MPEVVFHPCFIYRYSSHQPHSSELYGNNISSTLNVSTVTLVKVEMRRRAGGRAFTEVKLLPSSGARAHSSAPELISVFKKLFAVFVEAGRTKM